jgi:hypothetical protein
VGFDIVDLARRRAGVAQEPLDDFSHEASLDPGFAQFAVRRKRDEQRPLLLLDNGEPRFERRGRARSVLEPRDGDELTRPALVGLAPPDRNNEEARPAEVEILDVEGGDLGPPSPRGESQ